ncbi:MAG: hypothetical protein ACI834_000501, partial [Colwellia sp.]
MELRPLQSNLSKNLRDQGYDLINGPVRNYKILQLWLKKAGNPAELYYDSLAHAFVSDVVIDIQSNSALKVTSRSKNEYKFNMGMSLLEPLLSTFGLNNLELETLITSGTKISMAYEGSESKEVSIGNVEDYMHTADYLHPNPSLFYHANKDRVMLISGVLLAKNLVITIDTDFLVSPELISKIDKKTNGKLNTFKKNDRSLKMVSEGHVLFPIAVKANRLHFDKGH